MDYFSFFLLFACSLFHYSVQSFWTDQIFVQRCLLRKTSRAVSRQCSQHIKQLHKTTNSVSRSKRSQIKALWIPGGTNETAQKNDQEGALQKEDYKHFQHGWRQEKKVLGDDGSKILPFTDTGHGSIRHSFARDQALGQIVFRQQFARLYKLQRWKAPDEVLESLVSQRGWRIIPPSKLYCGVWLEHKVQ